MTTPSTTTGMYMIPGYTKITKNGSVKVPPTWVPFEPKGELKSEFGRRKHGKR